MERRKSLRMSIHTGMLESLGVNMYTSIGQSLVEFVANSFDADASEVLVNIPFEEIRNARVALRESEKEAGADTSKGVYVPLPDKIAITVSDNGHGMSEEELEAKFLSLSRNRRKYDSGKSESGKRNVMGRKGLGKLAGFGAAEQVIVITKRKGETYSTKILMDFEEISSNESVGNVEFAPEYTEGLDTEEKGTKIVLRRLRCDSIKASEKTIQKTLTRNFAHFGDDFILRLNGDKIHQPNVHYEFIYPEVSKRITNDLAEFEVSTEEEFSYPILAAVKFRARGESDNNIQRGHLPAKERGARVYCNGRLAAGPTLFDLPTGMHNFHSQSYMECIIEADVLDQLEMDLISTNRQGLKTDNSIVDAFIVGVTEIMRLGIREHGKFRDKQAEIEIKNDPASQTILRLIEPLDKKIQKPAQQILKTIAASTEGTSSPIYKEIAPHLVQAINSSEVLVELIKSGASPKDLSTIIEQLSELGGIERSDVLKLYRGRRSGINALQKLEEQSHEKGPKYEKDLHKLLKENPWLLRAEYGGHLTSDVSMGEVARKLNAQLGIDEKGKVESNERPDLVFVTIDTISPNLVTVVELKSPNVPLDVDHLSQLEGYIGQIERIIENDYQGRKVRVVGHLVGNLAKENTQARKAITLMDRIKKSGPTEQWEVITIPDLLARARKTHMQVIQALEKEQEN